MKKYQISKQQLLILDSYSSYFIKQFIQFYNNHYILLFTIIPYTTYNTQLLDVVVFQPYKN
jgi:hypothetical protein